MKIRFLPGRPLMSMQPVTGPTGIIYSIRYDYSILSVQPPKYKFSRAKWYYGHFAWKDGLDAINWCEMTYGIRPRYNDAWTRWSVHGLSQIRFRDEDDAIMFRLRWP